MVNFDVHHHVHKRKRVHEKHEPYPHPNYMKRVIDKLVLLVSVIIPLFTLPQVYKIWIEQAANGVSLTTWSAYLVGAFIWLMYGLLHKDKPIIIANSIMILLEIAIIVGVIIHG